MGNLKKHCHAERSLSDRVRLLFEEDERARQERAEAVLRELEEPEPKFPLGLETSERKALVVTAKELYRIRRIRTDFFSNEMFREAAWDILLTLYIAAEDDAISVSAAGSASGVPLTTSLRWIVWLEQCGLIERRRHANDARVKFLRLTSSGSVKMDQCLQALLRI